MMPCNMNNNRAGHSCSCGRPAPQPRSCGCSNGTDFRSRGNCENLRGGRPACPENQARLMEQIQQCEFICVDINLYLDTHPDDKRALSDYNCYAEQLRALKDMYVKNYGPLQNFGNSTSEGEWKWVSQPFPWSQNCGCGMEDK